MKIVKIGQHVLIQADQVPAYEYLLKSGHSVDFIHCDPNFKDIKADFDSGSYDLLKDLLNLNRILLHYTANNSGASKTYSDYEIRLYLEDLSRKQGLNFKLKIVWDKYHEEDLKLQKRSHRQTALPNDLCFLNVFIKGSKYFDKNHHINVDKMCKGHSIIRHKAEQDSQFKPSSLCRDILLAFTHRGDTVLDTHMGGANMMEECVKLNRTYIGVETDKKLFESAVKRLRKMCGKNRHIEKVYRGSLMKHKKKNREKLTVKKEKISNDIIDLINKGDIKRAHELSKNL